MFNTENLSGSSYFISPAAGLNACPLVMRQALNQANIASYEATGDLISDWRPEYIFLVGTAGAVWDEERDRPRNGAGLGDVVVGEFVHYVSLKKLEGGRYLHRYLPLDHPSLCLRGDFALPLRYSKQWHQWIETKRPDDTDKAPAIIEGGIAASETNLSDPENADQKHIIEYFDTAAAFEMESAGVARAVCKSRMLPDYNPQYLTIRGITDYINRPNGSDVRFKWTPYSANAALAFTRAVVENLLKARG